MKNSVNFQQSEQRCLKIQKLFTVSSVTIQSVYLLEISLAKHQ